MQSFGVSVFLGKDRILRFVPGVRNRFGIYVPIPEGKEISLSRGAFEIGKTYLEAAQNALNHYGEDLDMRKVAPKYKAFRGFRSQKEFNLNHRYIWSFADNGKIKFTFMPWHNDEFALYNDDIECIKYIPDHDDYLTIGETILDVFRMADSAYPENDIVKKKAKTPMICIEKNTTSLYVKEASPDFEKAVNSYLDKKIVPKEISDGIYCYSSEALVKLIETTNINNLHNLAAECCEMYCFVAYTTVGFYGFFHYKNGNCIRGYASLDESGEVVYNIGLKSNAEIRLKLNLPNNSKEFAEDSFDELNLQRLEQIGQQMIYEDN